MPMRAMKNLRSDCIGQSRFMLCVYFADMILSAPNFNANAVTSIASFAKASIISCISIDHVLRSRNNAEIFIAIIQAITIYVIALTLVGIIKPENQAMHKHAGIFTCGAHSADRVEISIFATLGTQQTPFPLVEIFKHSWRNASNHSLRQRDFTVRLLRGCHIRSFIASRLRRGCNPDTLKYITEAEPRFALQEGKS